jgi:quinol monooxygenase YgiN
MQFRPEERKAFLDIFNASKQLIRDFNGCRHLCLYNEVGRPEIFFTYSVWTSVTHLDAYRNSELFEAVWADTKALFADGAEAWSVEEVETVNVS